MSLERFLANIGSIIFISLNIFHKSAQITNFFLKKNLKFLLSCRNIKVYFLSILFLIFNLLNNDREKKVINKMQFSNIFLVI